MKIEDTQVIEREDRNRNAHYRSGDIRISDETSVMEVE